MYYPQRATYHLSISKTEEYTLTPAAGLVDQTQASKGSKQTPQRLKLTLKYGILFMKDRYNSLHHMFRAQHSCHDLIL